MNFNGENGEMLDGGFLKYMTDSSLSRQTRRYLTYHIVGRSSASPRIEGPASFIALAKLHKQHERYEGPKTKL